MGVGRRLDGAVGVRLGMRVRIVRVRIVRMSVLAVCVRVGGVVGVRVRMGVRGSFGYIQRLVGAAVDDDLDLGGGQSGTGDRFNGEIGSECERARGLLEFFEWHARSNGGAEKHVAAESGEAVEVGNAHDESRRAKAQDLTI